MNPKTTAVITITRADGTVPFDDNCHPAVRAAILANITDNGHSYDPVPGTNHVRIRGWVPGTDLHKPRQPK